MIKELYKQFHPQYEYGQTYTAIWTHTTKTLIVPWLSENTTACIRLCNLQDRTVQLGCISTV